MNGRVLSQPRPSVLQPSPVTHDLRHLEDLVDRLCHTHMDLEQLERAARAMNRLERHVLERVQRLERRHR